MQAVAELEEDDVGVVAHRQQYLAVVLGLLAVGLLYHHDVVYLRHAVHDDCHAVAEDHAQLVEGDVGVLHHVVQQGADRGYGAEPHFLDGYHGHRQGVEDIGLAALAAGAGMGFLGYLEGAQYLRLLVGREGLELAAGGNQFFILGLYLAFFAGFVYHVSIHGATRIKTPRLPPGPPCRGSGPR